MILNKFTFNYFLILFSLIPVSIIIGSAVSVFNILLIDLSFLILIAYRRDFFFLKKEPIIYLLALYIYLIFNSFISLEFSEGVLRNFGFIRIIILFAAFNYFFLDHKFSRKVFKFWLIVIIVVLVDVFIEGVTMKLVLFDIDNTLLDGDSDYEWAQFLIEKGVISRQKYERRNKEFLEAYWATCMFYEGLGVLVKEGFLPIRMVALLMSGMTRSYWEKIVPVYEEGLKEMGFSRWLSESYYLYNELVKYLNEHPELNTRIETLLPIPP